jgi:DNA-directed RNA polymerase specialized sigma24 family protein
VRYRIVVAEVIEDEMIRTIAGRGSFEQEWRAVMPSLERALARRGVSPWLRDDVMQETALRLYRAWDRVDPERPLLPLAMTIANNVAWDERHRRSLVEVPGEVPDVAAAHDVEELGLARLELQQVRDLMSRLSAPHRSVLLAEVGDADAPAGGPDATKMLRLRARKKMRSLLETTSAGAFVVALPKGLWRLVRGTRRQVVTGAAPAAIAAACSMVALFGVPHSVAEPRGRIDPLVPSVAAARSLEPPGAAERIGTRTPRSLSSSNRSSLEPARSGTHADPDPSPYWRIGIGDEEGPVDGEAGFGISPDPGGEGISRPECSVGRPASDEVEASCRADLGDQQIGANVRIRLRP